MQTPQFKICTDCGTMQELYNQINCSLYWLIKNKWTNVGYGTDLYFCNDRFKTLLRLKRIVYKRLFNQSYPSSSYTNQDLISIGNKLLYKQNECPKCPCIDFSETESYCRCYTLSYNVGPSAPNRYFTYINCSGGEVNVQVAPGDSFNVCANINQKFPDYITVEEIGDCSSECTSTTTTIAP